MPRLFTSEADRGRTRAPAISLSTQELLASGAVRRAGAGLSQVNVIGPADHDRR
jgi:hypothetical protein